MTNIDPPRKSRIEVSGDTESRLQTAANWMNSYPADTEILIIGATAEAADGLYLRVAGSRSASFGIRRSTLEALAARLARPVLADTGLASTSRLSFIAVVARAIHSLQSEGKLTYFGPVATRPGFPIAVARTLEELRMNEVDAQSIRQLENVQLPTAPAAFVTPGAGDLNEIMQAVDRELADSKLADRAVIFGAAIDREGAQAIPAASGPPLVLLDLQPRTRLELRLIRELALHSRAVLATVPFGDESVTAALEAALDCSRRMDTPPIPANSLAAAKQHLFAESTPAPAALDDSLNLASWPGEPRECTEIARQLQSEAARGVAFDQMAVFLNSANEYRAHLEEAFHRAEIPAYFSRGSTAPDPAGRAMLALLLCAAEGLSARRFAEYLSLGQVPTKDQANDMQSQWVGPADELMALTAPVEGDTDLPATTNQPLLEGLPADPEQQSVSEGDLRAPWRWEHLLVDSAVIGGHKRWVRRLDGLESELRLQLGEAEDEATGSAGALAKQLRDLDHLRAFALPAIELLAALPVQANWGEWVTKLREIALRTLREPSGVLVTLADLEPMAPVGPVDLYEVQMVLEPRLRDLRIAPQRRRYGCVFIGPVEAARGLSFEVVFVPGLAEKIFPRKLVEDPILPDRQRQEAAGNALITRRDRLDLERLALRLAIGAARRRVYLSYPRIDVQQSRPRVPSFYALEARRAAEGRLPSFEELASGAESATRRGPHAGSPRGVVGARLGWPAPQAPAQAIDESEYDLALLGSLVDAEPDSARGSANYLLSANPHLARALRARFRRWSRKWTLNDGLVDLDERGREAMKRHQLSARAFSSTALQNYASCPYRFFLSAVFRLRPREEVAALEILDPLTRGALFHEVQFSVLTNLKAAALLPLTPASIGQACDLLDSALDAVAGGYEEKLAPAIPRVWRDAIESLRADLREWLRRASENSDGWLPDRFELAFAMDHIGTQARDPDSVSEPVEIAGGLKLRGSIDLIERHANGNLRATDHKTGRARAEKNLIVGGGKSLQPLLYALAIEKLLGRPVESGRLYYCTAVGGYEERVVPLDEHSRAVITSVVAAIGQSLHDGFLPAAPEAGACGWCDFRAVCGPLEESRTRRKPRPALASLTRIRELP